MTDRLRHCRASLLLGTVLGFAAGVVVRSELQRRLRRLNKRRRILPDTPHRPVGDPRWPCGYWCGKPKDAAVHERAGGPR